MGDCNSGALSRRNRPREVGWNHFRSSTKTDGQSTMEIRVLVRLQARTMLKIMSLLKLLASTHVRRQSTPSLLSWDLQQENFGADDLLVSYYSSSHHSEMLCLEPCGRPVWRNVGTITPQWTGFSLTWKIN